MTFPHVDTADADRIVLDDDGRALRYSFETIAAFEREAGSLFDLFSGATPTGFSTLLAAALHLGESPTGAAVPDRKGAAAFIKAVTPGAFRSGITMVTARCLVELGYLDEASGAALLSGTAAPEVGAEGNGGPLEAETLTAAT